MMFLFTLLAVAHGYSQIEYENAFAGFLKTHGKIYEGEEVQYRFAVFKSTMDTIFEHNQGNHSWTMGINQFSDLTPVEFEKMHLGYIHRPDAVRNEDPLLGMETASDVDWTTKGAVTPIKDQAQCGSCWAFSTTGSTEGANFISKQSLKSLSEQQLVDCSGSYGNQGCNGGLMDNAFKYYLGKGKGAAAESAYPYTGRDGTCRTFTPVVEISKYTDVPAESEDGLKTAVTQQPVSIAVDARKWQSYHGGVFDGCSSSVSLDHGVLAVGYSDSGSYWKVKNSWGTSWGESGFIRLTMGKNECGLSNAASWPTV